MEEPSSSSKRQRLDDKGAYDVSAYAYALSSSTQPKLYWDVFINFRGCDVGRTLVKAIYDKLSIMGCLVSLDQESLKPGDCIATQIEEEISNAYLHVAIFSETYADSSWCLDELSCMLRTGIPILPIFYRVSPSDLRWVDRGKGIYSRSFDKHEEKGRYTEEKIREWKEALQRVSYLNGYVLDNDDYGELLENIANRVHIEGWRDAYDIFISHRGLDTKKNVASLIYHRLIDYKLRVYLAQEDPEDTDVLPYAKRRVISKSSVQVAIISVNYLKSSWCLNELWEMLQSGNKVIPIFYDIKSADLYQEDVGIHLVDKWKYVLKQASSIPGRMEFNTKEGNLGYFVEKVVAKLLNKEEDVSAVYNIFINHRGLDTKKNVASLLYHRLVSYGLQVFLDQEELRNGDILHPAIRSAISSSSIHIAIFSPNYVRSPWCLNELLDMLQSDGKVFPIFYDVKPTDLRYIEKGIYAEDFKYLQNKRNDQDNKPRHKVELVERWKLALEKASYISGTVNEKGHLANLVEEIVEKVLKEAKWEPLHVAEHPVGLHQAAEDFYNFFKEKQLRGTTAVGIMGLNGLGKSTLVKHLYNCNLESHKFKRYCFLELNKKDLAVLQQKLVRDLLGGHKYSISDTTKGNRRLQTCLKGCGPVLIVLDGLDKEEQIDNLLSVVKKDVLAEGSLILITCHDKDLLKGQVNLFYEVNSLRGKDAHDLFCWYAFHSSTPPGELEDLVKKFLKICCGFPLALKVLGRKLYVDLNQNQRDGEENRRYWEENRRYWEEQLKDLSRPELPEKLVNNILKVSYDCLGRKKKDAFLDVAHFLVGEDTDLAVRVLEGLHDISGFLCLEELQSKFLLDFEEIEHCKRPFAKGPGIQWRTKRSSKSRMREAMENKEEFQN